MRAVASVLSVVRLYKKKSVYRVLSVLSIWRPSIRLVDGAVPIVYDPEELTKPTIFLWREK